MQGEAQDSDPDRIGSGAPDAGSAHDRSEQARPSDAGRSEDQLRRAHKLESLGHLAAGVAHDMNNILGVILGYVELAKMNMAGADPKALEHMEKALSTLGRARSLADRLLDFTDERRMADVGDVNVAVQHVRELLGETLDRRVEFVVRLAPEVPPSPLDGDSLQQIVMNLCLNAADAMPRGGRITLETFRLDLGGPSPGADGPMAPDGLDDGSYAALRVRDTGPGIPSDRRERIFDPYVTGRPGTHSGLGLWVVRTLARVHGGHVEAGGDENGAVFTVWLPALLAAELPEVPEAAPDRGTAGRLAALRGGAADVLIVDDEPGVREITRAFLEMEGYSVIEAETGASALEQLRANPKAVRLVFLDQLLPDARGSELAWQVARMPSPPRIVMVTGMAAVSDSIELPPGTHVLIKPFLHDELKRLLEDDLRIAPRSATS